MQNKHAPIIGVRTACKGQRNLIKARGELKVLINHFGHHKRFFKISDSESYSKFQILFGMDVVTAQTLELNETLTLINQLRSTL